MASSDKVIEDYIADYVEGKCNDTIRQEIDAKREKESDFNMLVCAYENLLSVLILTPKKPATARLSEKILSIIRQREERIAEEQKRYNRELIMLLPISMLIIAVPCLFYDYIMDITEIIGKFGSGLFHNLIGVSYEAT